MLKRSIIVLLLAIGCSDSGVGPEGSSAMAIHLEAERIREATLIVGDSIALTAVVGSGAGSAGSGPVVWSVDDASVARLGRTTATTVVVHGESFGNARVVASAGALADTIMVSVLSGQPGGQCEAGGLELGVGQSYTTTAAAAPTLCLSVAPAGGTEFVVVPFNARTAAQRLRVEVTGEGISAPVGGAAFNAAPPHRHEGDALGDGPFVDGEFDRRLREREARELGPLVGPPGVGREPRVALSVALPAVGDTLRLNVNSQQTCTQRIERNARVMAVSERAIVLEDTSNPAGGFTAADYRDFGTSFDEIVYPTITQNFGTPSDIDGNGRVLILFTRAVNEMTAVGSESYVAGFFYARDLFPRSESDGLAACAGSNVAEILYMLAPDPTGSINGHARTREFLLERTVGVLGHELQHLVNASRRLRVNRYSQWNEEFWLNEGLSHVAEELLFYANTSYSPKQSITVEMLRSAGGGLSRFNQYQGSNFARFMTHLRDPEGVSPISGNDVATRGAIWAFLRYAADRSLSPEAEIWRRLVDSETVGYANLMGALGGSPMSWLHDWAVALYVDDVLAVSTRFRQPSWHYRSIMQSFASNNGVYPLKVTDLRPGPGGEARFDLAAAGAGIVRFRVAAGNEARLRFTSGGLQPPQDLRFTIIRTR